MTERFMNTIKLPSIRKLSEEDKHYLRSGVCVSSQHAIAEELILNAIDSRSRYIDMKIDLTNHFVEVYDDGDGFNHQDLSYIGQWNYSSKSYPCGHRESFTFGFKGEALAAISLVAKLRIISKSKLDNKTYGVEIVDGINRRMMTVPERREHGTTITVMDIFYNLPVRRVGMRPTNEIAKIKEFMEAMSMLHYRIGWKLTTISSIASSAFRKRRQFVDITAKASVASQFISLHSSEMFSKLREISVSFNGWTLAGLISHLQSTSCHFNRDYQYMFINHRWMRGNDTISQLLNHAFKYYLKPHAVTMTSKHYPGDEHVSPWSPCFVMQLTCPSQAYDVVSECDKSVAVFEDESMLHELVNMLVHELCRETGFVSSTDDQTVADAISIIDDDELDIDTRQEPFSQYFYATPISSQSASMSKNPISFEEAFVTSTLPRAIGNPNTAPVNMDKSGYAETPRGEVTLDLRYRSYGIEARRISDDLEKKYEDELSDDDDDDVEELASSTIDESIILPASQSPDYRTKRSKYFSPKVDLSSADAMTSLTSLRDHDPLSAASIRSLSMSIDKDILQAAQVIGNVDRKFIMATSMTPDGSSLILAIDQHAADERILFEQLLDEHKSSLSTIQVRYNIQSLSNDELSIIEENLHAIHQWGFRWHLIPMEDASAIHKYVPRKRSATLRDLPSKGIIVTQVPILVDEALNEQDFIEYVRYMMKNRDLPVSLLEPPAFHRIIASKACRRAVKFGSKLSMAEYESMIQRLARTKQPFQCAHGRPTVIPIQAKL
jgi:DNA mismatch repair protein MLH3